MAHHSLRRDPGNWIGGVITSADLEFFDLMQYRSIDGDTGGTWNPTAWIMLGGNYGLRIASTAKLWVDGEAWCYDNMTIGTTSSNVLTVNSLLRVNGNASFYGSAYCHDGLNADGAVDLCTSVSDNFLIRGTGHFYEGVTFDKNVIISGNTTLGNAGSDTVTVNAAMTTVGLFTVAGNASIAAATFTGLVYHQDDTRFTGGTVLFATPVSLTSTVTPGEDGYIVKRHYTTTIGETHSVGTMDVVRVATPGGTVFVADYGADGAVIRIINASSGTLAIQTPSMHTLRTLPAHTWIELMRDSTWGAYGWSSIGEGTYTDLV